MGRSFGYNNWRIISTLILLGLFGSALLFTIDSSLFLQQVIFLLAGCVLLFFFSRVEDAILRWFAPFGYVLGCIFLAFSYLGPSIRGATRWLVIAGIQFQPSELVKPLMLLAFSYFIVRYPPRTLKALLFHSVLFAVPFFLIFKQPDLGSSLIYIAMWLGMLLAGGFPLYGFFGGIGLFMIGSPLIWRVLADYQKARIMTFFYPALDPLGTGYNAIQSMIAVGSGQLFGRGLGLGTQSHLRFLPEFHTDFIFATLIEELGLVGGLILFTLYVFLLFQILLPFIRREENDAFVFVYAIGLFSMLLSQIFINTGMNMGIVPITGITLPLISYGGSSLLSVMSSFGLLEALTHRKDT